MGTRGSYGFNVNGELKLAYCHSDSYPDWLGVKMVEAIAGNSLDLLRFFAEEWEDVTGVTPTDEQIKQCDPVSNFNVGEQSDQDWYCLLRDLQGELDLAIRLNIPYFENIAKWGVGQHDYTYVIDLDNGVLEVYNWKTFLASKPLAEIQADFEGSLKWMDGLV